MPRTLTANVAQAIVAQEYGYDVLIEAPVIGLHYSWFYAPTPRWSHRLLRIESVEVGVPSGGGIGFVSQLVFVVAETGDTQSLLARGGAATPGWRHGDPQTPLCWRGL